MLAKTLYTQDETADDLSTVYCKCLNTKIDFINQSLNGDETFKGENDAYVELEKCDVNSTLFCRSFLISIKVKFKYFIGRTPLISNDESSMYLYKCHCCSYDLFLSTNGIIGACLINQVELMNFSPILIRESSEYSDLFEILIPNTTGMIPSTINDSLLRYSEHLREKEESAMRKRIEEFQNKEEEKLALFCDCLDRETLTLNHILQSTCIEEIDFKMEHRHLSRIEKDYNALMEANLKIDNEDVYNYLIKDESNGNHEHTCVKLPLNESGEIDNREYEVTAMVSNSSSNSISYSDSVSVSDENMGFDAISEEDEEDEKDKFDELSLTQTPQSTSNASLFKPVPELHLHHSTETVNVKSDLSYTGTVCTDIINEDSETDDRIFDTFDAFATHTRSRGQASSSKNDSLRPIISPLMTSHNFEIKSSKSLQIKSTFHSKSLLSKTLNQNSALVNLKKRNNNQSETELNNHSMNSKTFSPPKQWLSSMKKQSKPTLTVNKHTFTGIWANTATFSDDSHNGYTSNDCKTEQEMLFANQQNRQINNVYAYSMTPKYSLNHADQ